MGVSTCRLRRLAAVAAGFLLAVEASQGAFAQAAPPPPNVNAGTIARENQRVQQNVEREAATRRLSGPSVVTPDRLPPVELPGGGPRFLLKKVEFTPSAFLTEAELQSIAEPYLGRQIELADIQRIVNAVNEVYTNRGYVTASAVIPPQKVASGTIKINLVEGRVGALTLEGRSKVPDAFIRSRVTLEGGTVVDVPKLSRQATTFNRVNDVQIRSQLRPGQEFGLTDITLAVIEPPTDTLQVFADNYGTKSVGRNELGTYYRRYGLLGLDDRLTFYGVISDGNLNGSVGYNANVTPWNTRLGFSYTQSRIKIVNGPYDPLNIRGFSRIGAVSASQPVFVNDNWLVLANASASVTDSLTKQAGTPITNNLTTKASGGLTISYYADAFSASFSPTYSHAWTDLGLSNTTTQFELFSAVGSASVRLPGDFVFVFNGATQIASRDLLPGDQLFQIGGATTVRGYLSTTVAGGSGYYGNFELHHSLEPLAAQLQGLDAFVFVDHGAVYSTFPARQRLSSAGFGLSYNWQKRLTADVSIGFPFADEQTRRSDLTVYARLIWSIL